MPIVRGPNEQALDLLEDPEVRLALTSRSGPIVVEIEHRVSAKKGATLLCSHATRPIEPEAQRRLRMVDRARPLPIELWTERYHCPTWHDYLRQRNRSTDSERALHQRANEFHIGSAPIRVRRMLERPIGSVRWKDETPDRSTTDHAHVAGPSVAGP
jgi:hypothetical protein